MHVSVYFLLQAASGRRGHDRGCQELGAAAPEAEQQGGTGDRWGDGCQAWLPLLVCPANCSGMHCSACACGTLVPWEAFNMHLSCLGRTSLQAPLYATCDGHWLGSLRPKMAGLAVLDADNTHNAADARQGVSQVVSASCLRRHASINPQSWLQVRARALAGHLPTPWERLEPPWPLWTSTRPKQTRWPRS